MANTNKGNAQNTQAQAQAQAQAPATQNPAPAFNLQAITANIASTLNATQPMATLHNSILQAVAAAQNAPAAAPAPIMAIGGHACAGWRKMLIQHIAGAFGLVPCVQIAAPAPAAAQGQQATFYGTPAAAQVAAAVYNAVYNYVNINGNKLLREARAQGHAAGKTGAAGNRLQENVYNNFAAQVLAITATLPQVAPATPITTAFGNAYNVAMAKGGMVISGAYNGMYTGNLPVITAKQA